MVKLKRVFSRTKTLLTLPLVLLLMFSSACKTPEVTPSADVSPSPEIATAAPVEMKGLKSEDPSSAPVFDLSLSSTKVPDGALLFLAIHPLVSIEMEKVKVSFEGEEYLTFKLENDSSDYGALVAVPFNSKPRTTHVDFTWEEEKQKKTAKVAFEVIDGNYKSETLKVDEKKVSPPKRAMIRIKKEQKEIGVIYRTITPEKMWSGPFMFPLGTELTSPFGTKRVYNGHMHGFHQGLDFRARTPLPIQAPENARVAMAKDLYFTGNTIILDHGLGLFTIYGHMSSLAVKVGDRVKKAQLLGLSGASGRATGPHLHWGAVLKKQKFNPLDLKRVLR